MYKFGKRSKRTLNTCHNDIQKICNEAIKHYNFSIIEGTRTLERQQKLFAEGRSKLDGINKKSKHQSSPSMAIDTAPYPIRWSGKKHKERWYYLMGIIQSIANRLYNQGEITHKIRKGIDWDKDNDFNDQTFDDLPHWELYK